jgi:hypothetical protein
MMDFLVVCSCMVVVGYVAGQAFPFEWVMSKIRKGETK